MQFDKLRYIITNWFQFCNYFPLNITSNYKISQAEAWEIGIYSSTPSSWAFSRMESRSRKVSGRLLTSRSKAEG